MKRLARFAGVVGAGAALAAAGPSALSRAEGGLWEIARGKSDPVQVCIANPAMFAQFEHRKAKCSRSVIRDDGTRATVHYTCAGGGFGQSDVTMLTPRSLRVETQGISDGAPFKYKLQAHRVGDCPAH
ncbi:MAG TPA: DUF3617 family protein [Sphingomicrobium sp.]|nr:DUF3617 family protein [Sphingomicrobium sp.]